MNYNMNTCKKLFLTIIAIFITSSIIAQSSAVKKTAENVFTLTTFKKDGNLLASSHGVFIGANGEAISNLTPFVGAAEAVAIDSKGNKHKVTRILGVNDIYDVARFKVDGNTKSANAAKAGAVAGSSLWLIPYTNKSAKPIAASIKSVEKFMNDYSYYIFTMNNTDNADGCPFVNDNGEVIGLLQTSSLSTDIHATDANFILSQKPNALSMNSETLRKIGIPAALPEDKEQAMLALMLTSQNNDSLKYAAAANDFIERFPDLIDGYSAKAQIEINANRFDDAARCMEEAIRKVTAKADAHYNYAKLIYLKEVYKNDLPFDKWNLDKAMDETSLAYSISPLPLYKDLEGQILFAKADYDKAYDTFMALTESNLKGGDLYYNAALCKQQLKAPDTEIIALLDSAVNNADTLNYANSAKYYLMRAELYNKMQNYRQSVFDYTRYEIACGGKVTAEFYYNREQIEIKAKLFKQALNDINNAIYLAPKEPTFLAERASLLLRLNMHAEAIESATRCIETAPNFSDAYLVLGLAQIKTGNKTEGISNLNKAKDMGNPQAQGLIDKYAK